MIQRKQIAVFAGLVLGGGVLWWAGSTWFGSTGAAEASSKEAVQAVSPFDLDGLEGALVPGSDAESAAAVRALYRSLEASDMRRCVSQIEELSTELFETHEESWVIALEFYGRWGELAPEEALKFLRDHDSYWAGLKEAVMRGWARTDPDAAIAAYDPKMEGQYSRSLEDAVMEGLCEANPVKALQFADARERGHEGTFDPENRTELYQQFHESGLGDFLERVPTEPPAEPLGRALYDWMRRDPNGALEAILEVDYPSLQRASLAALFSNWLLIDEAEALAALERIEDRELWEVTIHRALQAYLIHDPERAFEQVTMLPRFVGSEAGGFLPDEIDDPLPHRFCGVTPTVIHGRLALISEAGVALGAEKGEAAWARAMQINDREVREAALGGVLAGWMLLDRDAAADFAFKGIQDGSLDRLAGGAYPVYAARLVGKMLAQVDFEQATRWAGMMPEGPSRERAIAVVAEMRLDVGWHRALAEASPDGGVQPDVFIRVQKREFAPVETWLLSLPPSSGRDDALGWLVFKMREHGTPAKALQLVILIDAERPRRLGFESIAESLTKSEGDSASSFDAEAWCEANPEFADEFRGALEESTR